MLHLHTERLAELGDDIPTVEEAAHLAACPHCAHERVAYQALVAMAIAEREPFGLPLTRWDAIAAALLLMTGGAMLGRMSMGAGALPGADRQIATAAPVGGGAAKVLPAADSSTFASIEDARAAQRRSEALYQQAAAFLARVDTTGIGSGSPVAYHSRLAALDRVISTTREAMREAPHDPVINGYYLTTLGQREATLRQLNTALPASLRMNSF